MYLCASNSNQLALSPAPSVLRSSLSSPSPLVSRAHFPPVRAFNTLFGLQPAPRGPSITHTHTHTHTPSHCVCAGLSPYLCIPFQFTPGNWLQINPTCTNRLLSGWCARGAVRPGTFLCPSRSGKHAPA